MLTHLTYAPLGGKVRDSRLWATEICLLLLESLIHHTPQTHQKYLHHSNAWTTINGGLIALKAEWQGHLIVLASESMRECLFGQISLPITSLRLCNQQFGKSNSGWNDWARRKKGETKDILLPKRNNPRVVKKKSKCSSFALDLWPPTGQEMLNNPIGHILHRERQINHTLPFFLSSCGTYCTATSAYSMLCYRKVM